MKKFKGIILDLDDTLYDYKSVNKIALSYTFEQISKRTGINFTKVEHHFFAARSQINTELDRTASSHNRLLYFQRMYEMMKLNPVHHALETYDHYWNTLLEHIHVNESVYEFLDSIKDKKICILTDLTAHIQHRKIKKLGLESYIDYLVTSEEAGREKPHPYMFLLAVQKMNLSLSEVCMIGDSYTKDILGAQRVNMEAFFFNPENQNVQTSTTIHSFCNFNELINMEMTI